MKDFNQDAQVYVLEHVLSYENWYYSKLNNLFVTSKNKTTNSRI